MINHENAYLWYFIPLVTGMLMNWAIQLFDEDEDRTAYNIAGFMSLLPAANIILIILIICCYLPDILIYIFNLPMHIRKYLKK